MYLEEHELFETLLRKYEEALANHSLSARERSRLLDMRDSVREALREASLPAHP